MYLCVCVCVEPKFERDSCIVEPDSYVIAVRSSAEGRIDICIASISISIALEKRTLLHLSLIVPFFIGDKSAHFSKGEPILPCSFFPLSLSLAFFFSFFSRYLQLVKGKPGDISLLVIKAEISIISMSIVFFNKYFHKRLALHVEKVWIKI